jgi:dTDP-4-dehydrorhamnose reductase
MQMRSILAVKTLELWGGCECTINRVGNRFHSQLARRKPAERLADLERIASLGIRTIRFPLLWEELAPSARGEIDWTVADAQMKRVQELGLRPIVGLVHHGSGPKYTSLVDPQFPELLAEYARAVAERYPWVEAFTPVNEPLTTARFSGLYGLWFPHGRDDAIFCRTLLTQVRAIAAAMCAVRNVNPNALLVQTEDLGRTLSTPTLGYQADFENDRRWLPFDLLSGRLDPDGPVWSYLRWAGVAEEELLHVLAEPCAPDVIGINHYVTSSRFLDDNVALYAAHEIGGNGRHRYADVTAVRAPAAGFYEPEELLRETWVRYRTPVAVTEAHLCSTREEQLRWLGEIWRAGEALRREQTPVLAVTAWSLMGAYDWDSLLTRPDGHYEPGAFDLRSEPPRATALAGCVRSLAVDGVLNNPLVRAPGWWRRSVRVLPTSTGQPPPRAFAPSENTGCPMLLITGATGTLGQAFARLCRLRGLPYRLLTRAEMDIADISTIRAALTAFRPWAIVNAAGYVRVDDAEQHSVRCFRENVFGPATLAEACRGEGVALLTFSSDLVFDGGKPNDYVEGDPPTPLNMYGASKAEAERQVMKTYPEALVVRTSAFFGPWDSYNFITQTLEQLALGKQVSAVDDIWISPSYIPDLVHAALDLLVDREAGIWHLANSGAVTWAHFARAAARLAGLDESLVRGCGIGDLKLPASRPRRSILRSARGQLLGSWECALERYFRDRAESLMAARIPRSPAAAHP